ncbi:small ribosomal subunit Rsm22 family protein [Rhizobium halophytocola]|uniref:Ribosomal protein RSM22 (Predicted rRNA methylase) n=1 Tax=Rhizobium halophytocola TaxID=735519 RepID=A0ABS4DYE0_9HYPH|nr:small ribosomal subunit Rsm22 family protein [Rhizobium halophytocola]MBP1850708.1 ribosomal protein RSM22 (predicted rRNA methylase) [Rhizobium halophytocola]
MELPAPLRAAVDRMLDGIALETLTKAGARLSDRYRREVRDGRLHIDDVLAAKAYLATRLPATFAAVRAALEMVADASPDFSPRTLIDAGSGPGTVLWAAADCWDDLESARMIEASDAIRDLGETLSTHAAVDVEWLKADVTLSLPSLAPADLVTLSYVLDEVPQASIAPIVTQLWALTSHTLVIIEPGTTAGWQRILAARRLLVEAGAHLVAPCPHAADCPIVTPDWCHFSRRVARSRVHRLAKQAEVPWEDEKYIFIAASRHAAEPPAARVLAPPRASSGVARLKLCRADGTAREQTFSRRDGDVFKQARRADWGDGLNLAEGDQTDGR